MAMGQSGGMDRGDNPRFLLDDWVVRPAGEAEDGDFSSKMLNALTRGSHGSAAPSGLQGAAVPVLMRGGGGELIGAGLGRSNQRLEEAQVSWGPAKEEGQSATPRSLMAGTGVTGVRK